MPSPGDTLVKRISLLDAGGSPILGETFTVDGRDPNGTTVTPDALIDLGNGIYEISLPTSISDPEGLYYVQVASTTTPVQVFELEWLVKPLGSPSRWRPGDTVMDYITVIGPDSNPVIGDTFSVYAVNTVGRTFTVAPPTEVGNGIYRVAVTTSRFDPPGHYYIQLKSNSVPTQVYEVEFETGQPVNLVGGTTLRTLRRRVMARFGDLVSCKATQSSAGSEFIDEDTLVGEPGRFAGREALFVTGMNAGQRRHISGSSRGNSSVLFTRGLPYPVSIGDECDITNAYGIGITFRAVKDAIDYAIDVARPLSPVPVTYTVKEWDGTTAIPIPAEAVGINDVYGIDRDGKQRHIRRASGRGTGWEIDRPSRTITIGGFEGYQASGYDIVVNARTLPGLLVDDDDVTMIPMQWLVETATAHLCLDTLLSRQASGDWGSKGMLYQQNAERLLPTLTPNIGPNYTAV